MGPIVIACPPGHDAAPVGDDLILVEGGATRARSVANALAVVETDVVAIHDAARPLLAPELVEGVVATLLAEPGAAAAIAATPVTDTIKRAAPGTREASTTTVDAADASPVVEETVDRGRLWAAQTPQIFWAEALRKALADPYAEAEAATDEAMLVEAAGGKVLIHPAPAENLKVTTPLDLRLAELLLAER